MHRCGRVIVSYEWLCGDPVSRYRELYDRLGLAWNARTERKVRSTNAEGNNEVYSLNRPAARQVDGWKERVNPDEIEVCRRLERSNPGSRDPAVVTSATDRKTPTAPR